MSANLKSDNPDRPDRMPRTGRLRYGPRLPNETEEQYAQRMAKGHAEMADLMRRTRRPWEYD